MNLRITPVMAKAKVTPEAASSSGPRSAARSVPGGGGGNPDMASEVRGELSYSPSHVLDVKAKTGS
jgi:hypothetical protein